MRFRERVALWGYLGAVNLLVPCGLLLALPVLLLKEKRRRTLFKRLGFQQFPIVPGQKRPVWIHALSLGETLSCVTLMEEVRARLGAQPICFSVSTLSAMQIALERIRPVVDGLFYFPLDLWWPVRRALRRISPRLVVFIETDIWPGFQYQLRRSGTPALLVNGRLSPDSFQACHRFRSLFGPALNTFAKIYPQSAAEGQRYLDVGVDPERVGQAGNLKFDVAGRQPSREQIRSLRERLGLRASEVVLLAGSTHPGEEEVVLEAYRRVRERMVQVRLIIVPRHPSRAGEVAALARARHSSVQLFNSSTAEEVWDVLVVDVMGVLSMLYSLATASFVGGSLVAKGGQNPLEPAAAGCPVVFGPDMSDFPDIARWLVEDSAAFIVTDSTTLAAAWLRVLTDADMHERMRAACRGVIDRHCGMTAAIAGEIAALVESEGDSRQP